MPRAIPKKAGVLMGGPSSEREVSLESGRAMEAALHRLGWEVVVIEVSDQIVESLKKEKVDLAVLAVHGGWGEDGTIQAILDLLGIPYTGSGVLSSAICMNKAVAKRILESQKLPTPRYIVYESPSFPSEAPTGYGFPLVVKPVGQGSTIGVSIVHGAQELQASCQVASRYGREILIEEYISGHEITAGIIGNEVLPLIRILPREGFYSYQAKYVQGESQYEAPANLSMEQTQTIQDLARAAHQALKCEGYSRVDFRVTEDGMPYILEVNTLPGMTSTSLLPKAAGAAGMKYDDLVSRIVDAALQKGSGHETASH